MDTNEYDLIIVGAGPSSAGLLRGLLTHLQETHANIHIAVLERGGHSYHDGASSFQHQHPSTKQLDQWFEAAHYSTSHTTTDDATLQSPTVCHVATPQVHLHHRVVDVPTGQGWGGSTNIHAGLFVPPSFNDFNSWPHDWRKRMTMAIDTVTEVFEKENSLQFHPSDECMDIQMANFDGVKFEPIRTSSVQSNRVNYYSILVQSLFVQYPELKRYVTFLSGMEVERILISDEEDETHSRAWGVECTVKSSVNKSITNNPHLQSTERVVIRARSEIILCAGAIGTPSILMASGIGNEHDLKTANITPWYEHTSLTNPPTNPHRDLAVGKGLRDHILLPRIFLTKRKRDERSMSCNSIHGWWSVSHPIGETSSSCNQTNFHNAKYQIQLADGRSIDKMIAHFGAGVIRRGWSILPSEMSRTWIDHAFYILRWLLQFILRCLPRVRNWISCHFVSLNVCLMNPRSMGRVSLVRRHHRNKSGSTLSGGPTRLSDFDVMIDPGYLSDRQDMKALWRGFEATDALKGQFPDLIEILPSCLFVVLFRLCSIVLWIKDLLEVLLFQSNTKHAGNQVDKSIAAWFSSYAAEFATPYYHWSGTCSMRKVATNEEEVEEIMTNDFVVDESLNVLGVPGLRICDASVFPECVTAPTALTCAALGYAASNIILSELKTDIQCNQQ